MAVCYLTSGMLISQVLACHSFPVQAPAEEELGECCWLWPSDPAVQDGVRNQRYLMEKLKGYAESFPLLPAPGGSCQH